MKAYKFRVYPNAQQQELIAKHFGCARHVYNWALAEKKAHYEKTHKNLSRTRLQKHIVKAKKEDKPWLKEVNSQSLLSSLFHPGQGPEGTVVFEQTIAYQNSVGLGQERRGRCR